MLVLARRESQQIKIGDDITVTVCRFNGRQVVIGIKAPEHIPVYRAEKQHERSPSNDGGEPVAA